MKQTTTIWQKKADFLVDRDNGQSLSDIVRSRWRCANAAVTASFVRELATLLSVGTPLVEALVLVSRGQRPAVRRVSEHLHERITAGVSLADAMAEVPSFFDDLCVQLTRVGEESGALDTTLRRLADFKNRTAQLRGRVGTALLYPSVVLAMSMVVTVFLMTFVVPNILEPLIDLGKPLPWPTLAVQSVSNMLIRWWWLLLLLIILSVVGISWVIRTRRGKRLLDGWVLKLPVFGILITKSIIVRLSIVLSTLLRSGVPMVQALQATERTIGNRLYADAIRRCINAIRSGRDIGPAVDETGLFPPLVVQVLSIGQESGQIEDMLDQLASEYDQQVAQTAQRLSVILEPVLILILAAIVLLIALATMLPILEAGNILS